MVARLRHGRQVERTAPDPPTIARHWPVLSMSITCIAATLLALLLLPIIVLLWATESRQQRARRWRSYGMTQQAIADRLGCSRSTVRRLLAV
jgi:DNA-directed RNA polymerase specialized sigma24 family protein